MTPIEWIMLASLGSSILGQFGKGSTERKNKALALQEKKREEEYNARESRKAALSRAVQGPNVGSPQYISGYKAIDTTPWDTLSGLGSVGTQLTSYYGNRPKVG